MLQKFFHEGGFVKKLSCCIKLMMHNVLSHGSQRGDVQMCGVYYKNNWASSYWNRASNMLLDAPSPLKSKAQKTTFHNMQREDDDQVNHF